ncbi:sulfate transporter 3.3 [Vigna angularis]|uniref:Sulfate transporter 3.3 n=1 Tax=Phaseolus angularis TaxID=3914 RepID=A0A8T0LEQ2_PHAAN|nr:sulfate transporter 3.3 [Vigna angularis]
MDPNEVQHSHCLEMTMEVHQVLPPPHKTTLHKLNNRLKETFFPDDPLRQFKGQPLKTKLILAAQYLFPILQWGPKYTFKLFKSDLVSGLTIASLAIPQGISYAKLANLPPIVGLLVMANDTDGDLLSSATTISKTRFFAIKAQNHGISVIGKLQQGINPPSWNMLRFHGSHLGLVMKTGLITGILSLTEGIAVGRTFAALKNYKVDGNKEMMAIGFMNVVGSSTSCYVTTGAFSRTAVNNNSGAKTAVSNVVMSVTVMVTLLFLMPLFQYTPNVVLGAIIVTAVIGLIDLPAAYNIWKIDKFDFLVMLAAFMGVLFISVQGGLALAVGLSTFKILMQITRPKTVMLGKIPGTNIYRNLHQYKEAVRVPGFLILSIEAPINFANITYLNERTLRWVEEEEDNIKEQSSLRFLILEMSAVSAIDTSGISLFKELKSTLEKKGVELVLVNPLAEVIEKLKKVDEASDFRHADSLFLTVGEAVASLSSTMKSQSPAILGGAHTIV